MAQGWRACCWDARTAPVARTGDHRAALAGAPQEDALVDAERTLNHLQGSVGLPTDADPVEILRDSAYEAPAPRC